MSSEIWSWGSANHLQLANPNDAALKIQRRGEMEQVNFPSLVADASGSRNFAAASTVDGIVYVWGLNSYGVIDHESPWTKEFVDPQPNQYFMENNIYITQVSCGLHFILALSSQGVVYGWGCNANSQIGSGCKSQYHTPLPVRIPQHIHIVKIAAGSNHSLALTDNGTVYGWGINQFFQATGGCGPNTDNKTDRDSSSLSISETSFQEAKTPQLIRTLGNEIVQDISTKGHASAALTLSGVVYTWGYNRRGQTGHPIDTSASHSSAANMDMREHFAVPVRALPISEHVPMKKIAMGCSWGFCISKKDQALYGWGRGPTIGDSRCGKPSFLLNKIHPEDSQKKKKKKNKNNTRSIKSYKDKSVDPKLVFEENVSNVYVGKSHAIIRKVDESVYVFGANRSSQCGIQTKGIIDEPKRVDLTLHNEVFCGYNFNGTYDSAKFSSALSGFMKNMLLNSKTNRDIECIVELVPSKSKNETQRHHHHHHHHEEKNIDENNGEKQIKTLTLHSSIIAYRAPKWYQNDIICSSTKDKQEDKLQTQSQQQQREQEQQQQQQQLKNEKKTVTLQTSSFKVFDHLFNFIYTGRLPFNISTGIISKLSSFADQLHLPQLKQLCELIKTYKQTKKSNHSSSSDFSSILDKCVTKLSECQETLRQDMLNAMNDANRKDGKTRIPPSATVKTPSGASLNTHKEIICCMSPVISLTFKQEMQESKTSVIVLEELTDQESLSQFLHHIYTLESDHISLDYAVELMELGARLEIPSLENAARSVVIDAIDEETVGDLIQLAYRRRCVSLLLHCIKFISAEFNEKQWESIKNQLPSKLAAKVEKKMFTSKQTLK